MMKTAAKRIAWATFVLAFCMGCPSSSAQQPLQVTYIANEGMLIADGATHVLIDGLYRPRNPTYAVLPAEAREAIETSTSPYDEVDVVLVSHVHSDHFQGEAVGRHLQHNPRAMLLASQQVADSVAQDFDDIEAIRDQIRIVSSEWKEEERVDLDGVQVEVLGLRHSSERNRWVQNLGHIIHISGQTLLHIGDADTTPENFAAFNLPERDIDIAFIPFWYLVDTNGQAIVRDLIQPKHIVAVHIPPGVAADIKTRIRQHFPEADAFTAMLETRRYE